jgi:hypothetical protein
VEKPGRHQEECRAERRRRRREAGVVAALLLVGVVIVATAGDSILAGAIGWGVCGLAGVAAISLVFYEIGLGEERDRARGGRGPYDRGEPSPPEHLAAPRIHRPPRARRR